MIGELAGKLRGRRDTLRAIVGERDDAAIWFLRACGFEAVGVIRGFFPCGDDAYRFELTKTEAAT